MNETVLTQTRLIQQGPHQWTVARNQSGKHYCYFCAPDRFFAMPDYKTLCARCGDLIGIDVIDPMNKRMVVCPRCARELEEEP